MSRQQKRLVVLGLGYLCLGILPCPAVSAAPPRTSLGGSACVANAQVTAVRNETQPRQPLDATAQGYLRPWFGALVEQVQVVWQARLTDQSSVIRRLLLRGSRAQTYGTTVYIAPSQGEHDPGSTAQLVLLAHELVHVEQYVRLEESVTRFCEAYMQGWAQGRGIYTRNPLEQEAFDKAFAFAQALARQGAKATKAEWLPYRHEGDPTRQVLLPRRVPALAGTEARH